jgi:hypothetical protein
MGKKSLIKSTAKKKTEPKKAGEPKTKKAAAKSTKKTAAKTTKKAATKTTKKTAAKTAQKTAANAAKPAAKKAATKKLTVKELTFLKFEPIGPVPAKVAAPQPAAAAPTAPPLITAQDAGEADRLHALLAKKFSMDDVRAAAKAPAEKPASETPAAEAEPEPAAAAAVETEPAAPTEPEEAPTAEVSEPVQQPKAAGAPPPEPRPVLKPAQVTRKTVVTPKPAPKTAPVKAAPSPAYTDSEPQRDPVVRSTKIAGAAAALLIFILLAVSAVNSGKYYIKPIDNAIEIWKGDFSPKDKSFFMVLHGVQAPEPQKSVYAKKDVYPIIFKYYLDKSDTLLDVEGLPDFEGIKKYLHKAQDFAIDNEMESAVKDRLNTIDRMVLLYKADVAISRNTEDSLESAIDILKDAGKLTSNATQDEEIAQKIELARKKIEALKTPATAPEAAAPAENTENTEATEAAAQHPNE